MHEDLSRAHSVRSSSNRSFGIVFAVFFATVALWPLRTQTPIRFWALAVSAVVMIISFTRPAWLSTFNLAWTKFGALLGRIMNPLITGLLFFLVVTPMALFMRMFGKDTLRLVRDRNSDSYWMPRQPPGPPPGTMTNQY